MKERKRERKRESGKWQSTRKQKLILWGGWRIVVCFCRCLLACYPLLSTLPHHSNEIAVLMMWNLRNIRLLHNSLPRRHLPRPARILYRSGPRVSRGVADDWVYGEFRGTFQSDKREDKTRGGPCTKLRFNRTKTLIRQRVLWTCMCTGMYPGGCLGKLGKEDGKMVMMMRRRRVYQ